MARTVPNGEPRELNAADSWQWDKSLSDTPPSEGYTLQYVLEGPANLAAPITASTSSEGDYFEVRDAPSGHDAISVQGTYVLVGYVTKGSDRFTVYEGEVYVQVRDVSTARASNDEEALQILEQKLRERAKDGRVSVGTQGDETRWDSLEELQQLIGFYRARVGMARRGGRLQRREVHFRRA